MSKSHSVMTFKVDEPLSKLMRGMTNRSEFIRNALLAALGHLCPLCKGTGILTPQKKEHWAKFSQDHNVRECRECHGLTIVCRNE